MSETTPLIKAALNLRVGAGFDVYEISFVVCDVNSEKERLQVNFLLFEQIFI